MPLLIQSPADPKHGAGAVTVFVIKHLLPTETKVIKYGKPSTTRVYSGSVWKAVYQFWVHLIWAPRLGKRGKKSFCEIKQILRVNTFFS